MGEANEVPLRSRVAQQKREAGWVPNHSWCDDGQMLFNQAVVAHPAPTPPTNEVINTYFIGCAIEASSVFSGE